MLLSIRRPMLVRGTKAACSGIVPLLTISGHAFSYQAMLLSVFRAQIGGRSASPDPLLEIHGTIKNPSDFKLVFKLVFGVPSVENPIHKSINKINDLETSPNKNEITSFLKSKS